MEIKITQKEFNTGFYDSINGILQIFIVKDDNTVVLGGGFNNISDIIKGILNGKVVEIVSNDIDFIIDKIDSKLSIDKDFFYGYDEKLYHSKDKAVEKLNNGVLYLNPLALADFSKDKVEIANMPITDNEIARYAYSVGADETIDDCSLESVFKGFLYNKANKRYSHPISFSRNHSTYKKYSEDIKDIENIIKNAKRTTIISDNPPEPKYR